MYEHEFDDNTIIKVENPVISTNMNTFDELDYDCFDLIKIIRLRVQFKTIPLTLGLFWSLKVEGI